MTLPDGYEQRRVGEATLVAHRAVASELANVLGSHASLYEWAASLPQPVAMRGRAPVYVATLPRSEERVVVRHAWHGGALAPLTGDRFRAPSRAPRELAVSQRLQALGVSTTELLGYALHPAWPAFVRVDVVTRLVPDAHDLGSVLAGHAPGWDAARTALHVRALLRQLAAAHLHHPDLNVKNVLVAPSAGDSAYVIDVDVMRELPSTSRVHAANVARLLRSIDKWATRSGDASAAMRDRVRALRDGVAATTVSDLR